MSLIPIIGAAARRRAVADFSPTDFSGLILWLDGADASTMFDAVSGGDPVGSAGSIARWEDKSGGGRHATQATSGNRPTRQVSVRNGNDVVRFVVSSSQFLQGELPNFDALSSFLVFVQSSTSNFARPFSRMIGAMGSGNDFSQTGHYIPCLSDSNTANFGAYADGNMRGVVSSSTGAWRLFRGIHTGAQIRNSINNGSEATYSHTLPGTTDGAYTLSRNAGVNTGGHLTGDIAELIVYDKTSPANEIAAIQTYLAAKWDISLA